MDLDPTRMEPASRNGCFEQAGEYSADLEKARRPSVETGRTMAQIAAQRDAEWQSTATIVEIGPEIRVKAAVLQKNTIKLRPKPKKGRGRRSAPSLPKEELAKLPAGNRASFRR